MPAGSSTLPSLPQRTSEEERSSVSDNSGKLPEEGSPNHIDEADTSTTREDDNASNEDEDDEDEDEDELDGDEDEDEDEDDEFDDDSFDDEDDFSDEEEELDEYSVSLNGDSASYVSGASSVATDDQTYGTGFSNSARSNTDSDRDARRISRKEVSSVRRRRCILYFSVLVLGAMLPFSLFRVASNNEEETFGIDFDDFSDQLGAAWQENIEQSFSALDALAVDVTLATAAADSNWPFVTLPEFAIWGTNARYLAPSILGTALSPTVILEERASYKNYTMNNKDWIYKAIQWQNQSESYEGNDRNLQQLVGFSSGMASQMYEIQNGKAVIVSGPGPFYPVRHIDPINSRSINYNLISNIYLRTGIDETVGKSNANLGPILLDDIHAGVLEEIFSVSADGEVIGTMTSPVSDVMGTGGQVVGILASILSWNRLLENVLPSHVTGVVCVVENTCNQIFSLEINGPEVVFLGYEDTHKSKYHGRTYDLQNVDLQKMTASRIPLDDENACSYTLSVYPSDITKDAYETSAPAIYALIAVVTFILTLFIVGFYDYIQERRNHSVLKSALEARAIVSSLFPAVVRDRLFETRRDKAEKKKKEKRDKKKRKKKAKKSKQDQEMAPEEINAIGALGTIKEVITNSPMSDDMEKAPKLPLSPTTVQLIMDSVIPPLGGPDGKPSSGRKGGVSHPKHRLKNFLALSPSLGYEDTSDEFGLGKPIADLFPHTTVLFADIVGFTAWSSEREPEQVFTLLQQVYHAFDKVAKKRAVFKVETIGDCYVAVTGLPDPQPDHAVRMTKFARECMTKMTDVTKKLEVALGPDTGDLCMRLGLNSGPVTAGVLQGEKSRFQLFGDTVNTASRMESTGERNRIQVSKSTADALIEAGKSYWVKPREDLVHAKGKGKVQTYWVVSRTGPGAHLTAAHSGEGSTLTGEPRRIAPSRTRSALTSGESLRGVKRTTSDSIAKMTKVSQMMHAQGSASINNEKREDRLIQWQAEMFLRLLKKIVAARTETADANNGNKEGEHKLDGLSTHTSISTISVEPPSASGDRFISVDPKTGRMSLPKREPSFRMPTRQASVHSFALSDNSFSTVATMTDPDKIVVDEVAEVIALPRFNPEAIKALDAADSVELGETIVSQLNDYITTIARMYRQNPFHNFEHASHVTMSANKLLNRIVIPENVDYERETNAIASDLHDYTYGITSDPLTQFAVVFSALVHDVDHTGVPNVQLAKENPDMSKLYRNQSVAEQNSVDLAWDLFMDPRYRALQDCIAANNEERKRFRQLVVNSVMATDIFDKGMKNLRDKRWDKAFHRDLGEVAREINETSIEGDRNMKATIVIEHIIQASDVAHTMQHWHIYQKWNERLFDEMYSAFECGRSQKNPAEAWYKGELWFFDNYVIPLAKKLEECNVFGVASDECLNYAQANRNEWSVKGEEAVQEMIARYHKRKFFVAGMAKKRAPNRPKRRERQRRQSND